METLRSVLNQTFPDFELLVVNDGSTDGSLNAISEIDDERMRIISIHNSGVCVARNTGIKAAKYEWIAFLDADDYWESTFLEELVNAISENPTKKIFATGRSRVFQSKIEPYKHDLLPPKGSIAALNYYKIIKNYLPVFNSSSVLIHKSLFETAGLFKPGQRKHEDHDMWIRLAVGEDVVFVNKNLSYYRKLDDNTASTAMFRAEDFCTYIGTMLEVRDKLSSEEHAYFKAYYNRYTVLVYLQYYGKYSKDERTQIYGLLNELLEGRALRNLRFIHKMPLRGLYPFYKKLKGK